MLHSVYAPSLGFPPIPPATGIPSIYRYREILGARPVGHFQERIIIYYISRKLAGALAMAGLALNCVFSRAGSRSPLHLPWKAFNSNSQA